MSKVSDAAAALEAVKAKRVAIDNELFDLGRDEQGLQEAHGAAIALGDDSEARKRSDATRAQLDGVAPRSRTRRSARSTSKSPWAKPAPCTTRPSAKPQTRRSRSKALSCAKQRTASTPRCSVSLS